MKAGDPLVVVVVIVEEVVTVAVLVEVVCWVIVEVEVEVDVDVVVELWISVYAELTAPPPDVIGELTGVPATQIEDETTLESSKSMTWLLSTQMGPQEMAVVVPTRPAVGREQLVPPKVSVLIPR